ncbi:MULTISPECIES: methionine/alanine import family NSS transporter small subunit [Marinococcus]|uniref:Putative methionine and alanine importer, small subunit n=1 Tax=Marinococcus luteus TaxID=1122204 RepID=A0A1H2XK76_9BACI|nr:MULTISPECIES: methionine/alanine import family NSS transporter small subunit [Marinococcus]MDX6151822.1 methionine/alanine import family NSS transporter small subunit [Marinococcus sp. PL1-022]MDZ5783558.1 methionine/alanine import family NSS transporter small subunit [Marinococcus luteus]SDW93146.1 Putative methionine and alanine importer, small subunit [Marinococcus luteus]
MTAGAIITMVVGMVIIWGGLVASLLNAKKASKQK